MRQLWAVVLLAVLSSPLITPLVSAPPEVKLPPCCRRDGKHGCAMMDAAKAKSTDTGPGFRSGKMKCPLYPADKAAPAAIASHVPPEAFSSKAPPLTALAATHPTPWHKRSEESFSASKRGPPGVS